MKLQQTYISEAKKWTERPIFRDMGMPGAITMVESGKSESDFLGFGVAITGASCYMLHNMQPAERTSFLQKIYSKDGLNLSIGRLTIGLSDYSAEAYTYDDVPGDVELKHFSIAKDEEYIIPMIKEILAIRPDLTLFASPWTPPAWMKTGENLFGGYMRENYVECYADYIVRFLKAYAKHGIQIHAITPQNEPETHQSGKSPACIWSPETEAHFVCSLRRRLQATSLTTEIWLFDHNFSAVERVRWTLNLDEKVRKSVQGIAFHYYDGVIEETAALKKEFPELGLHFTEGGPRLYDHYETDWCKWGIMISKAISCGYKSFTGWNLLLDEMSFPNVGPFGCGGLFTKDSQTGELKESGQSKAFRMIAPYVDVGDRLIGLRQQFPGATCMFEYPTMHHELVGIKISKPDGREIVMLVNATDGKRQVKFEAMGQWWYVDVPHDSISIIAEKNTISKNA